MGFWKSIRETLSKKVEPPKSVNPMAQPAPSKPTIKRTIRRTIPVRYLVAKKKCWVCNGKGDLAIELNNRGIETPCMCLKIKKAQSKRWSRRYWTVLKTLESKEIVREVLVTKEQAEQLDKAEAAKGAKNE